MPTLTNEQLIQYLLAGIPVDLIKNRFTVSPTQIATALIENPKALEQLQKVGAQYIANISSFNPDQTYGTGIQPYAAVVNPTEQKYEGLGQISKDYFDAIAQSAGNPEDIKKLREKYLDSEWLKNTYGQDIDVSAMVADTQNFLDDELKRGQAQSEAQYNAWAKQAEKSGLLDAANPLSEYFKNQYGVEGLGSVPSPEATWSQVSSGPTMLQQQGAVNRLKQQLATFGDNDLAKSKWLENYILQNTKEYMNPVEKTAAGFGNWVTNALNDASGLLTFGKFGDLGTELLGPNTKMTNAPTEEEALKAYAEAKAKTQSTLSAAKANLDEYNKSYDFWASYLTGGKTPYQAKTQQLLAFLGKK